MKDLKSTSVGEVVSILGRLIPPVFGIVVVVALLGWLPFLRIDEWTWQAVVSLLLTLFSATFFYFDWLLREGKSKGETGIFCGTLSDCLNKATEGRKRIQTIRIYSLSSGHIHPILAGILRRRDLEVELVSLLLCKADASENSIPCSFNSHIESKIKEWESLAAGQHVGSVILSRFRFLPTDYFIVVDQAAIVFGRFRANPAEPSFLQVGDSFCVSGDSAEGRVFVQDYVIAFESLLRSGGVIGVEPSLPTAEATTGEAG